MPSIVKQIVAGIVRAAVVAVAAYLAGKADIHLNEDQIGQIAAYLTPIVAVLAWSAWQKNAAHLKLVTALKWASLTEHQVEAIVKDPDRPNPSVLARKDVVPS